MSSEFEWEGLLHYSFPFYLQSQKKKFISYSKTLSTLFVENSMLYKKCLFPLFRKRHHLERYWRLMFNYFTTNFLFAYEFYNSFTNKHYRIHNKYFCRKLAALQKLYLCDHNYFLSSLLMATLLPKTTLELSRRYLVLAWDFPFQAHIVSLVLKNWLLDSSSKCIQIWVLNFNGKVFCISFPFFPRSQKKKFISYSKPLSTLFVEN